MKIGIWYIIYNNDTKILSALLMKENEARGPCKFFIGIFWLVFEYSMQHNNTVHG